MLKQLAIEVAQQLNLPSGFKLNAGEGDTCVVVSMDRRDRDAWQSFYLRINADGRTSLSHVIVADGLYSGGSVLATTLTDPNAIQDMRSAILRQLELTNH